MRARVTALLHHVVFTFTVAMMPLQVKVSARAQLVRILTLVTTARAALSSSTSEQLTVEGRNRWRGCPSLRRQASQQRAREMRPEMGHRGEAAIEVWYGTLSYPPRKEFLNLNPHTVGVVFCTLNNIATENISRWLTGCHLRASASRCHL